MAPNTAAGQEPHKDLAAFSIPFPTILVSWSLNKQRFAIWASQIWPQWNNKKRITFIDNVLPKVSFTAATSLASSHIIYRKFCKNKNDVYATCLSGLFSQSALIKLPDVAAWQTANPAVFAKIPARDESINPCIADNATQDRSSLSWGDYMAVSRRTENHQQASQSTIPTTSSAVIQMPAIGQSTVAAQPSNTTQSTDPTQPAIDSRFPVVTSMQPPRSQNRLSEFGRKVEDAVTKLQEVTDKLFELKANIAQQVQDHDKKSYTALMGNLFMEGKPEYAKALKEYVQSTDRPLILSLNVVESTLSLLEHHITSLKEQLEHLHQNPFLHIPPNPDPKAVEIAMQQALNVAMEGLSWLNVKQFERQRIGRAVDAVAEFATHLTKTNQPLRFDVRDDVQYFFTPERDEKLFDIAESIPGNHVERITALTDLSVAICQAIYNQTKQDVLSCGVRIERALCLELTSLVETVNTVVLGCETSDGELLPRKIQNVLLDAMGRTVDRIQYIVKPNLETITRRVNMNHDVFERMKVFCANSFPIGGDRDAMQEEISRWFNTAQRQILRPDYRRVKKMDEEDEMFGC